MSKLRLTVACGDYDIARPLIEGAVKAEGLDLVFLSDMGPRERHWRMGRKHEFDVCEENVGAYFMIRDQDEPLTAIPVFLHRRFRHGFVFVNSAAGIKSAKDLNGKVVGMIEGGGQGKTTGKYGEAHYIAVSPRDEIFVADTLNWRIQKYVRK